MPLAHHVPFVLHLAFRTLYRTEQAQIIERKSIAMARARKNLPQKSVFEGSRLIMEAGEGSRLRKEILQSVSVGLSVWPQIKSAALWMSVISETSDN